MSYGVAGTCDIERRVINVYGARVIGTGLGCEQSVAFDRVSVVGQVHVQRGTIVKEDIAGRERLFPVGTEDGQLNMFTVPS